DRHRARDRGGSRRAPDTPDAVGGFPHPRCAADPPAGTPERPAERPASSVGPLGWTGADDQSRCRLETAMTLRVMPPPPRPPESGVPAPLDRAEAEALGQRIQQQAAAIAEAT